nr:hypothetical protein [Tanacetum cinerariifolium]
DVKDYHLEAEKIFQEAADAFYKLEFPYISLLPEKAGHSLKEFSAASLIDAISLLYSKTSRLIRSYFSCLFGSDALQLWEEKISSIEGTLNDSIVRSFYPSFPCQLLVRGQEATNEKLLSRSLVICRYFLMWLCFASYDPLTWLAMSYESIKTVVSFIFIYFAIWSPAMTASYPASLLVDVNSNFKAYVNLVPSGLTTIRPAPDPSPLDAPSMYNFHPEPFFSIGS